MYVCIGKVVYKHFKFVQSLKQSVKWPSGTVADKDVNSKSLSLKDNPISLLTGHILQLFDETIPHNPV
jgi:hypothetical protein